MRSIDCEVVQSQTYLYGLLAGPCCDSVVIMGFRSCFLRFLPLFPFDEATALPTCLALLMAAFLMLSEPFMMWAVVTAAGAGLSRQCCCDRDYPAAGCDPAVCGAWEVKCRSLVRGVGHHSPAEGEKKWGGNVHDEKPRSRATWQEACVCEVRGVVIQTTFEAGQRYVGDGWGSLIKWRIDVKLINEFADQGAK